MKYLHTDTAAMANELAANTGLGDLGALDASHADAAETAAVSLELRVAMADPESPVPGIEGHLEKARAIADAVQKATGRDTSQARADALGVERARHEAMFFGAEWWVKNGEDQSELRLTALAAVMAQADAAVAVIDSLA